MKTKFSTIENLRQNAVQIGRYPNGDIDYYFNAAGQEIGYVIFPGYSVQLAVESVGRKWSNIFKEKLNFTKIK